jgi:hypothetical protein
MQGIAFGIKEDGVMLLPTIVALEAAYSWMVDREVRLPPSPFLVGSCALLLGLLGVRHLALGSIGGYGTHGSEAMWANWTKGLIRTAFYIPLDRPGKWLAAFIIPSLTLAGIAVGCWRRVGRPAFLSVAGLILMLAFDVPFAFATKREQWYLLSIGGAIAFTGSVTVLWQTLSSAALRAALGAVVMTALVSSGWVARQMSADFDQFHPVTLQTDQIVVGWHMVAPEIRDYLRQKADLMQANRKRLHFEDVIRSVTYGVGDWESEPSGRRFRWTSDEVIFYCRGLPNAGGQLPVRALPRAPGVEKVRVTVAGRRHRTFVLDGPAWTEVPLGRLRKWLPWQMGRVDLLVDPAWVPATVIPGSSDQRRLGVKIGEFHCTGG